MNAEKMVYAIKILLEDRQARLLAEREKQEKSRCKREDITDCEDQLYVLEELIESCREGWEEI